MSMSVAWVRPERAVDRLARMSPTGGAALALAVLAGLILFDGLSPVYRLTAFYILPSVIAGWTLGRAGGLAIAAAAALAAAVVARGPAALVLWNGATLAATYCTVALVLTGLRDRYDRESASARTDGLTGALNARAFAEAVDRELHFLRTRGDSLLLAYCDLDGFKAVNDRFGHAAGDGVLRAFAAAARCELSERDMLARVGGDEFVLLTTCDAGDCYSAAEAIHARLTDALGTTGFEVTCSMGAVVIPARSTVPREALLGYADELMYEVKRAGKNALRLAHAGAVGG